MIYFDNSATTFMSDAAKKAYQASFAIWGNPSSLHLKGIEAYEYLQSCRQSLANKLCCSSENVHFSSGGTSSNNVAIFGTAMAQRRRGKSVITTAVEHPSVLQTFKRLELFGFNVIYLGVNKFGQIDEGELKANLSDDVILVSMMNVNNELGTITDVEKFSKIVHSGSKNALFHSDFVQSFLKTGKAPGLCGVDLASISSHKLHGPKGVGALYVKDGIKLISPICGGGQEQGLFSGTEPMPAIASFAAAVEKSNQTQFFKQTSQLKTALREGLGEIDCCIINSPDNSSSNIINFSLIGYPSEVMMNYLSSFEIYVSAGSACSKGKASSTLKACGLENKLISSALRVSFSEYNNLNEVDEFIETLKKAIKRIRAKK